MSTGTLAYILAGGVGIVVLVGSYLLGGVVDAEVGVDTDADSGGGKTPFSPSVSTISAGLVGFGVVGWIASANGVHWLVTLLCALTSGIALAVVLRYALSQLASKQHNATASRQSYVGTMAMVSLRIPPGAFGEVVFNDASGAQVSERAWSEDDAAIPLGVTVVITAVTEGGVKVAIPSLTPKKEQ